MQAAVYYEVKDYGIIYLNRPEKRNALSLSMAYALADALTELEKATIPFLVIKSTSDLMYCAGGDLRDLHSELEEEAARETLQVMLGVLYKIITFPVPVISLLNANALGGGCELASACDIRIAKENTKFGYIQTTLGILPAWGGGEILYEKVAADFALQWLTEGRVYGASDLERKGWIHRVIPSETWGNEAEVLEAYTAKSIPQMKYLKQQYLKRLQPENLYKKMQEESQQTASIWGNETHRAVLHSFFNKEF